MCLLLNIFVSVLCLFLSVQCEINVKDSKFQRLPPIFHIDDYEGCKENKYSFCKVAIALNPQSNVNKSEYWTLVEETISDENFYNHNELFHAICVQTFCSHLSITVDHNHGDFVSILSECYTSKYNSLGIEAKILNVNCNNYDNAYRANFADYIVLLAALSYGTIIICATWKDYKIRINPNNKLKHSQPLDIMVSSFSIFTNWEKLQKLNAKYESQKLKFLQGIRFYNMLLIIFCHTVSSYIGGYVENTDYFETVNKNMVRLVIRTLLVFLVQTFFLFSAFLLSFHILQVARSEKSFKLSIVFLSFLNRYLRILAPVLVMISLGSTMWIVNFFYGPIKDLYSDFEYQMCQKNWWTTLLFINNHYNQYDMCYFITWYLAADTQLYMFALIVLSLMWKFPNKSKSILACFIGLGILIPAVISHIYNLDIIYRITPENAKNNKFRSFSFNAIYSSTYTNMATYMVGIYFGYLYLRYKDNNLFQTQFWRRTWIALFVGLPVAVIVVSSYQYSRWLSTILCGMLKPLYATGIGIGILGMSQSLGGIAKRVCEWKPAVFLGNFTYSTYIVHYGIVFYRTAVAKKPLYVSDTVLITSFVHDAVLSFMCGLIMHLLVEMPALHLQHRYIPHVRRRNNA